MLSDCKVRLGDRVRIIKPHDDEPDTESFINATGTVIEIDESYEFPYQVRFDDEKVERYSDKQGTLLFKREQLEFHFDEIKVEERLDEDVCN